MDHRTTTREHKPLGRWLRSTTRGVRAIRSAATKLEGYSDGQLLDESRALQFAARAGEPQRRLLTPAFGLLCETIRRTYGMTPYDVQLLGGMKLCRRAVVEMATGEGKTLTALFPLFLRALSGEGAWLATANDYLAARDAEFGRPVLEKLGMSVGVVVEPDEDDDRRAAYLSDVTYGTAVQFGFDFLRDRAKRRFEQHRTSPQVERPVQRGRLFAALLDEADSLLIDEAATPLLIAGASPEMPSVEKEAFHWAARLAPECAEGTHYRYKKIEKQAELTPLGRRWVRRQLPGKGSASDKPAGDCGLSMIDYYDHMQRAIGVRRDFLRDREYMIHEGEVLLVDEGTGRVGKGRQWSEGIQQAVQAKENVPITLPSGHLAKVTVQSFFLSFEHISGMTGTAKQAAGELRSNYRLGICEVPTRLPTGRKELPSRAFVNEAEWLAALREECLAMIAQGRSVLIGARSVAHSDRIATYLNQSRVPNQLLNARQDEWEAEVVAHAGQPGRVTVATNMAGRGTDVDLHSDVRAAGGLHVVLAGIHTSKRIDRQLIGRAGRKGDPGSHRKMLCLEDDLLDEAFQAEPAARLRQRLAASFSEPACLRLFERAQRTVAARRRESRRAMFHEEKKHLRYLHQAGLDPLLDLPG